MNSPYGRIYETTYQAGFCSSFPVQNPIVRIQVKRFRRNNSNNCVFGDKKINIFSDSKTKIMCPNCINTSLIHEKDLEKRRQRLEKAAFQPTSIADKLSEYYKNKRKTDIILREERANKLSKFYLSDVKAEQKQDLQDKNEQDDFFECNKDYGIERARKRELQQIKNYEKNMESKKKHLLRNVTVGNFGRNDRNFGDALEEKYNGCGKNKIKSDVNPLSKSTINCQYKPIKSFNYNRIKTAYLKTNYNFSSGSNLNHLNPNSTLNSKRENRSLQHILSQNEFYNAAKKQREFNYIIRAYNDKRSKEEDKELLNYRLKKESAKIIKEKKRLKDEKDEMCSINKKLIDIKNSQKIKGDKIDKEIERKMLLDNYKEIKKIKEEQFDKKLDYIRMEQFNLNNAFKKEIDHKLSKEEEKNDYKNKKGILFDEYLNKKCKCEGCCKCFPKNVMTKIKVKGKSWKM